jgi:hypothetical protein
MGGPLRQRLSGRSKTGAAGASRVRQVGVAEERSKMSLQKMMLSSMRWRVRRLGGAAAPNPERLRAPHRRPEKGAERAGADRSSTRRPRSASNQWSLYPAETPRKSEENPRLFSLSVVVAGCRRVASDYGALRDDCRQSLMFGA